MKGLSFEVDSAYFIPCQVQVEFPTVWGKIAKILGATTGGWKFGIIKKKANELFMMIGQTETYLEVKYHEMGHLK